MISERVGEIDREYSYFSKDIQFHAFEVITTEGKQYFSGHDLPLFFHFKEDTSTSFEIKQEIEHFSKTNSFDTKFLYPMNVSKVDYEYSKLVNYAPLIQLHEDLGNIKSKLRKSYLPLINKTSREFDCLILEPRDALLKEGHDLHTYVSGRQTRSVHSWNTMTNAISSGNGMALALLHKKSSKLVGFSFFHIGDKSAYYSVGAYDRNVQFRQYGLGHLNLWTAILELKKRDFQALYLTFVKNYAALSLKERTILYFFDGFSKDKLLFESL